MKTKQINNFVLSPDVRPSRFGSGEVGRGRAGPGPPVGASARSGPFRRFFLVINSGSGLDLFPRPLRWRDSRSARPSLRTRASSCRAGRIAGRCAAPAPGPRGQVGPSGSSSGLEGFSFSASASLRVSYQGSGKRRNKEPPEGFKKNLPPFFFLKSHFLKGFLRVFRLGGRGWESGASAAPPNHPACCAQSQPASPRLGAGLSTEGRDSRRRPRKPRLECARRSLGCRQVVAPLSEERPTGVAVQTV